MRSKVTRPVFQNRSRVRGLGLNVHSGGNTENSTKMSKGHSDKQAEKFNTRHEAVLQENIFTKYRQRHKLSSDDPNTVTQCQHRVRHGSLPHLERIIGLQRITAKTVHSYRASIEQLAFIAMGELLA